MGFFMLELLFKLAATKRFTKKATLKAADFVGELLWGLFYPKLKLDGNRGRLVFGGGIEGTAPFIFIG